MHRLFQQQNRLVARKLGTATFAMFTFPILVFYVCYFIIFASKTYPENWAGACAVVAANVVVAGYVMSAFKEDEEEQKLTSQGDEAGPRVGVYKMRTD